MFAFVLWNTEDFHLFRPQKILQMKQSEKNKITFWWLMTAYVYIETLTWCYEGSKVDIA